MKYSLLICLILISGCFSHSTREKWLLGGMVASQIADGYTTSRYMDIGGTESNRHFLGKRPDEGNIYLFKGAVIGILYGLGEIFPDHREGIYTVGIVSGAGPAIWNTYLYEKHK